YAMEPAIASIEVNNENSFGVFPPARLASLPEPFAGELRKQWLAWLKAKYVTTAALRAAWGLSSGQAGPNLIRNPNFTRDAAGWVLENHDGARSTLSPIPDGTPGVRWNITQ